MMVIKSSIIDDLRDDELAVHVARAVDGDHKALSYVVAHCKDDVYRLCLRMLGSVSDAQDASQEILIKMITHLKTFRGDSSMRTWMWTIATRHLIRSRRWRARYVVTDFETLSALIDEGAHVEPISLDDQEAHRLAEEVRLGCTQAMLSALKPAHRIVYILSDIFGLESIDGARVLHISSDTFRKRLQRARNALAEFMERKCGLANPVAACRCVRQIPVALHRGIIQRNKLLFTSQSRTGARLSFTKAWDEMTRIDHAARIFQERANESAPEKNIERIRSLINSRRFQILDA